MFELFGLLDHFLDFAFGGNSVAEIVGVIDLYELCVEVGGYAMAQFLDGIDTGCLKEFGKPPFRCRFFLSLSQNQPVRCEPCRWIC